MAAIEEPTRGSPSSGAPRPRTQAVGPEPQDLQAELAAPECEHRCLDTIPDLELGQDGRNVGLHRLGSEMQPFGDLPVGEAGRQEAEDIALAGGKAGRLSWPPSGIRP